MDNDVGYFYDAKFEGNILNVGQTGYGKTTFVQNLATNKMLGSIKEVYWLSKISLSRDREESISDCFDVRVDFKYPKNLEEFDTLLELFQRKREKNSCNENFMGENTLLDRLIVMDNVSGLADKSENFANFLTVSRKFGFTCIYIFHTIYPTRNNWQMILSKRKIFNIFPGSIQPSSVVQILSPYCSRYTYEYIPYRDLWLNRLFFNIFSSNKKQCLTIDTRDVNDLGPARFRTQADNKNEQICYYNRNKKDKTFNCFLALRKQTLTTDKIIFSTKNPIDKSNKKDIYFEINDELSEFNNDIFQFEPRIRRVSESDASRETPSIRQQQQQQERKQEQTRHDRRDSKKPRFLSG